MNCRLVAFAGTVMILSAAPSVAQSQSGKVFMRYDKPLKNVTIDLGTGTITRKPPVHNKAATTTVDFRNNDLSGFIGVDSGNSFCEWFDAGTKGLGNASDLMNDVVFAYCASRLTPGSGGPGGSTKLGFYEGYTVGGGALTTMVSVMTLTGLPGNTASSSFFGGFRCYFTHLVFGSLVPFADGPIGYSWKFVDVGTTGTLAGTWPFLACVTSCSGMLGQTDGAGMTDAIDEYCPAGTLRSTFSFGTPSGSFTSMSMDIREATDLQATNTRYNATTTPNKDQLTATGTNYHGGSSSTGGPCVGGTWTITLTRHPATGPGLFHVTARTTRLPGNGWAVPGVEGRLLAIGQRLGVQSALHNGTTGSVSQSFPLQLDFVSLHYVLQASAIPASPGFSVRLSSAIESTTGTF